MKKIIAFFVLIYLMLIPQTTATVFNTLSPGASSGIVGRGNGFFSDELGQFGISTPANIFLISENSGSSPGIYIVEPVSYGNGASAAYKLINRSISVSNIYQGIVASDGHVYWIDTAGIKKRKSIHSTVVTEANDTGVGGDVSLISSLVGGPQFLQELNGYIYYLDDLGVGTTDVKRFPLTTGIVETYISNVKASAQHPFIVFSESGVTTVIYYEELCGGCFTRMFKANLSSKDVQVWDSSLSSASDTISIFATPSYVYQKSRRENTERIFYAANLTTKTVDAGYSAKVNSFAQNTLVGPNTNVVVYAATTTSYNIFNFLEAGITQLPAQIVYSQDSVHSLYPTYANNSIFSIRYNLEFDDDSNAFLGSGGVFGSFSAAIVQNYQWSVEILSPQGVQVAQTYPIGVECLNTGIFVTKCRATATILYSPPSKFWTNGSHTVRLLEINSTSGNVGLLDSETFNVLNFSADISSGQQKSPATGDVGTTYQNILASGSFGLIIILIVFAGVGMAIGGFFGSALGFGLGVIVGYMNGMLPTWALFLFAIMVFLIFAVVAGKAITGGRGGE